MDDLLPLPDGTARVRLSTTVRIDELAEMAVDEETGDPTLQPVDLSELDSATLAAMLTLRDGRGQVHRFLSDCHRRAREMRPSRRRRSPGPSPDSA